MLLAAFSRLSSVRRKKRAGSAMTFSSPRFHLRMRTGWEAADLGLLIWRERPAVLLLFFTLPFLCGGALCAAALLRLPLPAAAADFIQSPSAFFCALFAFQCWLKPLYERSALHICSKLFFLEKPSLKDFFAGLFKSSTCGLLGDLLWRRFSPSRGVMLPLRVLERPPRCRFQTRKRQLERGGIGFGAFLTVFCLTLKGALIIGSFIFLYTARSLFGTENVPPPEGVGGGDPPVLFFALAAAVFVFTETLYVCMSFAVYVNSRVITEGWDLELSFRRLR
jgi:hypothetical protein